MPIVSTLTSALQELVWHSAVLLYFSRVTVLGRDHLPRRGPVLYVGLHRNGAVDGFVYHRVVPRAVFMISTQLRRSLLGRLFFAGIEVVRDKDRDGSEEERTRNRAALEGCLAYLAAGGELFVLPEGSSDLGPRHLPFRRGAAYIAQTFLARGGTLQIVPLGIHYERGWEFRSRVEVVVGEPIDTRLDEAEEGRRVDVLHERIARALETVGFNVASAEQQEQAERLAYAATLGNGRDYFAALKAFELGVPPDAAEVLQRIDAQCAERGLLRHQGVPLVPLRGAWLYTLVLGLAGPVVLAAMLVNAPPLVAAVVGSAKLANGRNVVALWRILVGLPALALWASALCGAALASGAPLLAAAYIALTGAGIAAFYRTRKLTIAVYNALRAGNLRRELLELHRLLGQAVDHAR